jgi:predicted DNA-binding transcriptional regulator YafY
MAVPTTRVLAVLDLLQSHGRMSGSELAARVGVGVRTLRRYIVMLEELGIPITTERGRHGAYLLVAGFKLPPMMFSNDEAVALSIGLVAARGLGLADAAPAVASAQAKLARVMPATLKRHADAIAQTVRIDLRDAVNTPASNAALIALTAAARDERRVRMDYEAGDGARTAREIDPYGLVFRTGAWYAVGFCHLRQALRSFRLDRIGEVRALEAGFSRPAGFDVLQHLVQGIAAIPRGHRIEVLLHTDLARAGKAFPLAFGLLQATGSGVLLCTSADDLAWFARQLAMLPFGFEIRTPDALRAELARHASDLLASAGVPISAGEKPG